MSLMGQVEIFLSYSRKDEQLLRELEVHLAPLRKEGRVATWSDRMLEAGTAWEPALRDRLERSQIILLLVSPDFFASEFCWGIEMTSALSRHEKGDARVIPVILRSCDWRNSPLAHLQALPQDGRPIRRWPDPDEAFLDVVTGIRQILGSRPASPVAEARAASAPVAQSPAEAPAPAPDTRPVLRLELEFHRDYIPRILVDRLEQFVVTCSSDETVRVWDLTTGALLQILRSPASTPDQSGQLPALAISPDGDLVVCSGIKGVDAQEENIYLFDRRTGTLTRRIGDLPRAVLDLAISPDGSHVAAALADDGGVYIFDRHQGTRVARLPSKLGCTQTSYAPDGRLVVISKTCELQLFSADYKLLAKLEEPDLMGAGVAFSPNGDFIAVFYSGELAVDVFKSGNPLKRLRRLDTPAKVQRVVWSHNGMALLALLSIDDAGDCAIRRWERRKNWQVLDVKVGGVRTDFAVLKDRSLVCSTPAGWEVISAEGNMILDRSSPLSIMFMQPDVFRTDSSGDWVKFSLDWSATRPRAFSIAKRAYSKAVPESQLESPRITLPGLKIAPNQTDLTLRGKPLSIPVHETCQCHRVAPDGSWFAVASTSSLSRFHRNGKLIWSRMCPHYIRELALPSVGNLIVAAVGDGTIRYIRASDGEEVLALFPHHDGYQWVLWTPSGYYDCSPRGEALFGWQRDRGPDRAPDFYPASEYRERYYRPAVISNVLDTLDEVEAVRRAGGPW
jgi:WD40 repeat protein